MAWQSLQFLVITISDKTGKWLLQSSHLYKFQPLLQWCIAIDVSADITRNVSLHLPRTIVNTHTYAQMHMLVFAYNFLNNTK